MSFEKRFTQFETFKSNKRESDFKNLLKVLQKQEPERPTLFEFFLNEKLYEALADESAFDILDDIRNLRISASAFNNAGYDYVTSLASDFHFITGDKHSEKTKSLNEGGIVFDPESFAKYMWNEPENYDCSRLERIGKELRDGMKIIVYGLGVLENVIGITGYDNLCFMIADEPELVEEMFNQAGSRMLKYYKIAMQFDSVGAAIVNDDWGFNTQTMLSTNDMRKYVMPWHKKIVELIHNAGRPAIMHSCGNFSKIWDDVIDDIGFDAKHSFEDNIEPVEEAYERLNGRIAVVGGIDVDFICRHTPEEVYNRAKAMLERTKGRGGYALGSGNSIPYYVPHENYLAMIAAAVFE